VASEKKYFLPFAGGNIFLNSEDSGKHPKNITITTATGVRNAMEAMAAPVIISYPWKFDQLLQRFRKIAIKIFNNYPGTSMKVPSPRVIAQSLP